MLKRFRNLQVVRANKYEIYPSLFLGAIGIVWGNIAVRHFDQLAISLLLCLIAGVCAFNASGDERMGNTGKTFSLTWLALLCVQFIFAFLGMMSFSGRGH